MGCTAGKRDAGRGQRTLRNGERHMRGRTPDAKTRRRISEPVIFCQDTTFAHGVISDNTLIYGNNLPVFPYLKAGFKSLTRHPAP